jgi:hypothetical protein
MCFGQKIDYKAKVDSTLRKILEDYRAKPNYIFLKYGEEEITDTLMWIYEKELQPSPKIFQTIIGKKKKEGQIGEIKITFGFKNSKMKPDEIIYAHIETEVSSTAWLFYTYQKGKIKLQKELFKNGISEEIIPQEVSMETFSFVLRRINNTLRTSK